MLQKQWALLTRDLKHKQQQLITMHANEFDFFEFDFLVYFLLL